MRDRDAEGQGGAKDVFAAANGKGKGKEREWTEADYVKACEALAYDSVNLAIQNDKGEVTYPTQCVHLSSLTRAGSARD